MNRIKSIAYLVLVLLLLTGLTASWGCQPSAEEIEELIQDLRDNEIIALYAAIDLKKMGKPAVEPLIAVLDDRDKNFRDLVISILVDIGEEAVEPLIAALDNRPFLIQARVAEVLKGIEDPRAAKAAEQFFKPIGLLCAGQGAGETAAYGSRPDLHPIVMLDSSDSNIHQWIYELPGEWVPASLNDVELVACVISDEKVEIKTCYYTGNHQLILEQCQAEIRLIEARTGRVLDQKVFYGSMPSGCPDAMNFPSGYVRGLRGTDVSFEEVQQWLSTYVIK